MRLHHPYLIAALLVALGSAAEAQQASTAAAAGADAVEKFQPGQGAGFGVDYFPGNVLGLPDSTARADVPSVDPKQILGLGLGGEIVLRFDRHVIVDGPGADFTVFENAFRYSAGSRNRVYAEPGEVAVSRDGVTFVPFPFDSLTLHGCAGVTPTNGDADPGDPALSGGDSFDLAQLGMDSVRYVRIRDVTGIVKGNPSSPFWDPTLNGFDLDAVVVLPRSQGSPLAVEAGNEIAGSAVLSPNPIATFATLALTLDREHRVAIRLIDALGRTVRAPGDERLAPGAHRILIDRAGLGAGVYIVAIALDGIQWRTLRAVVVQ
ncbi:MAG TPA: hypothetical protein VHI13_01195 [Candidatus Kapabacteria bacterium]|nr:hypothetical protein [Candidatus Kapabacteria bacterium]